MASLISAQLKLQYGISIPTTALMSLGEHIVPDNIIEKIHKTEKYFRKFESSVEVVDTVSNPTGNI